MKVRLSKLASFKLSKLLNYLETEWSGKTKQDFLNQLDHIFKLLSENPKIGSQSDIRSELRKIVITKQCIAYYSIDGDIIHILTIFDARQDQNKINQEIDNYFD